MIIEMYRRLSKTDSGVWKTLKGDIHAYLRFFARCIIEIKQPVYLYCCGNIDITAVTLLSCNKTRNKTACLFILLWKH